MTRDTQVITTRLLLFAYLIEAALLLIVVGIYKASTFDLALLPTRAGAAVILGTLGLVVSGFLLAQEFKAAGPQRIRAMATALAVNLFTCCFAFFAAEATVRLIATKTPKGPVIAGMTLDPSWPELRLQSRQVIQKLAPQGNWDSSYFVYDAELGWTVGANRSSENGLYFSSAEGIRSAGPHVRFADENIRNTVVLLGDSNAFSLEVPFEESWGQHLQELLGGGAQVLNFGVNGYGIDQMYLRYLRDVRPWKPRVVIVGFIGHNFVRSMVVYPFISFDWPGMTVKPRFVIDNGAPRLLNVPLPAAAEVLAHDDIGDLPYIDYDFGYGTTDWRSRFDRAPMVVRYLRAVFPRWVVPNSNVSETAEVELNSALLARLVESVEADGATPLLVFLSDPTEDAERLILRNVHAQLIFAIPECLGQIPADRRKTPSGDHYNDLANLAIARCTASRIRTDLRAPIATGS